MTKRKINHTLHPADQAHISALCYAAYIRWQEAKWRTYRATHATNYTTYNLTVVAGQGCIRIADWTWFWPTGEDAINLCKSLPMPQGWTVSSR